MVFIFNCFFFFGSEFTSLEWWWSMSFLRCSYSLLGCSCCWCHLICKRNFFFWFNFGTLNKTKTKIKRINLLINKMVIIKLWSASFFLFFYFVSLIAYTSLHTNYKQYTQFIWFEPKPKYTILILKLKWCWNSQTANNLFNLVFLRYIQSFALYSFPDLSFPSHINKRKKWLNRDLALNIYFRMASFF